MCPTTPGKALSDTHMDTEAGQPRKLGVGEGEGQRGQRESRQRHRRRNKEEPEPLLQCPLRLPVGSLLSDSSFCHRDQFPLVTVSGMERTFKSTGRRLHSSCRASVWVSQTRRRLHFDVLCSCFAMCCRIGCGRIDTLANVLLHQHLWSSTWLPLTLFPALVVELWCSGISLLLLSVVVARALWWNCFSPAPRCLAARVPRLRTWLPWSSMSLPPSVETLRGARVRQVLERLGLEVKAGCGRGDQSSVPVWQGSSHVPLPTRLVPVSRGAW